MRDVVLVLLRISLHKSIFIHIEVHAPRFAPLPNVEPMSFLCLSFLISSHFEQFWTDSEAIVSRRRFVHKDCTEMELVGLLTEPIEGKCIHFDACENSPLSPSIGK